MKNLKRKPNDKVIHQGNSSSSSSAMSMGGSSSLHKPAGHQTAYPYAAHQEAKESSGLSKGAVNIGQHCNKGVKQNVRNVASSPVNIGHHYNEGGDQEIGDIEIEAKESSGLSKGTVNVGYNDNKWGKQKVGKARIGNRAAGSELASSPFKIPENINTGNNTNEGGDQEIGDIEIGNIG